MKPKRSEYSILMKELKSKRSNVRKKNKDEHEIIKLFIKNTGEIIDPYSAGMCNDNAVINPQIIEYLESRVHNIAHNRKITIEIEYGETIPDDPFLPEKLIKKELKTTILASMKRNRRILVGAILLALAGIGILAFINKFPLINDIYAINELFVVISWVFIWRFVEMFFFDRTKLRFRQVRMLHIFFAEYKIKETR